MVKKMHKERRARVHADAPHRKNELDPLLGGDLDYKYQRGYQRKDK
jgi:hypothetical protein